MRTIYFDCFAGASGDMMLGALVAAGVDADELREQLQLLAVKDFDVSFERVNRAGIAATKAHVRVPHEHVHRNLQDILTIINGSRLKESVKERASQIFTRLAEAEARVHNESIEQIHFHEVGAMDAIIDIVGACIGFELLEIKRFISSPLNTGSGTVEMAHGRYPVPPPAVVELMKDAPVYSNEVVGELLTPTGAAIISTVCKSFGAMPKMKIQDVGYGAGGREYPRFPNALRVIVGETEDAGRQAISNDITAEHLQMLETNIDDASPQLIGYVMERAFKLGALDCYFTSVQMKKNRPGVLVSVLCESERVEVLREMLFAETTTIGVRNFEVLRHALPRCIVEVETEFGSIDVKVSAHENQDTMTPEIMMPKTVTPETVMPEYEACRAAAERAGVALRVVETAAREAYRKQRLKEFSSV